MFKQILTLIIALGILIFSGIWEINYLENSSKYLMGDIDNTINYINQEKFDMAKVANKNVISTWKNMKFVWNIFVNHERVDDLEEALVDIESYIEFENKEESISSANKSKRIINQIVEKQKFTPEHIL
ncbi:putative uncharacterized protein [Clostridium sp. CAG:921]|nr:putative uncharacterized protein [Clostridium sp. CAG:921]